jgi:hypothetical protein
MATQAKVVTSKLLFSEKRQNGKKPAGFYYNEDLFTALSSKLQCGIPSGAVFQVKRGISVSTGITREPKAQSPKSSPVRPAPAPAPVHPDSPPA